MERKSLIVYVSVHDAAKNMPNKDRLAFYDAIFSYGFEGKEPENLPNRAQIGWILVKPVIDSNNKKYVDGQKGGRPPKTSGLQEQKTTGYKSRKPNKEDKNKDIYKKEDDYRVSEQDAMKRKLQDDMKQLEKEGEPV